MTFSRITHDPAVMGGKPCIRGLRITVATVLGLLASGVPRERILQAYPDLEPADLEEAVRYGNDNKSVFDVLDRAGLIGCLESEPDSPTDLGTNPEHMEGFGHE